MQSVRLWQRLVAKTWQFLCALVLYNGSNVLTTCCDVKLLLLLLLSLLLQLRLMFNFVSLALHLMTQILFGL